MASPCSTCRNSDPIRNGLDAKGRVQFAVRGWCSVKSAYPFQEQPGQIFPAGVARVAPGELARPVIVREDEVVPGCALYQPKR